MPIMRIEMFAGRDREKKRELVRELTDTYVKVCGGTAQGITIILTDVEKEDWGSAGELCCDRFPD